MSLSTYLWSLPSGVIGRFDLFYRPYILATLHYTLLLS